MTARRLTSVDAQNFWMSAAMPNDQLLLYAFDGPADDLEAVLDAVREAAQDCPDLCLRVEDSRTWTYPSWVPRVVGADQFVVHDTGGMTWEDCLSAVATLADEQLDATEATWRLHVLPGVLAVPGASGVSTVAVVQVSHTLADGVRASALAAHLFGRRDAIGGAERPRVSAWGLPLHAVRAAAAHRRLVRDTDAGLVPPQALLRPALRTNSRPAGSRSLRALVFDRERLAGPTVTVGVLSAVSEALAGHLRALGEDPSRLGAEVPMARAGKPVSNNHFGNVGVELFPDEPSATRGCAIAADLYRRRRRSVHAAMAAEARATAALPAPLLRWGVGHFDPDARSDAVIGNTVVSSVNRGADDLTFGGAPVLLTTGAPGLSPMMGLTHGVHGIGDVVVVSVHAAESAIGNIDAYAERLRRSLSELRGGTAAGRGCAPT